MNNQRMEGFVQGDVKCCWILGVSTSHKLELDFMNFSQNLCDFCQKMLSSRERNTEVVRNKQIQISIFAEHKVSEVTTKASGRLC